MRRKTRPSLRFTPLAWAKLLFLRDRGPTEVGGFGISSVEDLLLVEDLVLVPQICSPVNVSFLDEAVADHFDTQIDRGVMPERCGRIWIHTHPGDCPEPSGLDEETFSRVFGPCRWAVMAILARGGESYARIRFDVGTHSAWELPIEVDYREEFGATDHKAWRSEYETCVQAEEGLNCQQLADEFFPDFPRRVTGGEPGRFEDLEI